LKERGARRLDGIVNGAEIEPVALVRLPERSNWVKVGYDYQVNDGFHRFHASVAAGFEFLPTRIVPMASL